MSKTFTEDEIRAALEREQPDHKLCVHGVYTNPVAVAQPNGIVAMGSVARLIGHDGKGQTIVLDINLLGEVHKQALTALLGDAVEFGLAEVVGVENVPTIRQEKYDADMG